MSQDRDRNPDAPAFDVTYAPRPGRRKTADAGLGPPPPCVDVTPSATPWLKLGLKRRVAHDALLVKADEGLHRQILDMLRKRIGDRHLRILDWGCGTGALSEQLAALGHDVLSIDVNRDEFAARTPFEQVDFEDPDAVRAFVDTHRGSFDLVLTVEVIEHVRNPWDLMSTVRELTREDGFALVSTPNTGSVLSRLVHLRTGELFGFLETDLSYGHISPVSMLRMRVVARDTGWRITAWAPGGTLPVMWLSFAPRHLLYTLFSLLARPFITGANRGWCLIFLLERTDENGV